MGGSVGSEIGGGGTGGVSGEYCSREFVFTVVIIKDEEKTYDASKIGQKVYVVATSGVVPRLEVKRSDNDDLIGLVPSSQSGLLGCLQSGWSYEGEISQIQGNRSNPQIIVKVNGIKA